MAASGNDFSAIAPTILASFATTFSAHSTLARLVNKTYSPIPAARGSTVDVPVPAAVTTGNVSPTYLPLDSTAITVPTKPITIDQWKFGAFAITDKQMTEIDRDKVIPVEVNEVAKKLAADIENYLFSKYVNFYGAVGTAGTTPFATTIDAAVDARKLLNQQLAPDEDRTGIVDVTAEANMLKLAPFRDASQYGNPNPIQRGRFSPGVLGADWTYSLRVPTHTAGTGATITHISNSAAGVTSVTLAAASGTLVAGDIITFAGHTQQYVVTGGVTLVAGGVATGISPALAVAVDGSGAAVAVTKVATHTVNLLLHKDAIFLASRPMTDSAPNGLVLSRSIVDPDTQMSFRLQVVRQTFQTQWLIDVLFGAAVIYPNLGVRILG